MHLLARPNAEYLWLASGGAAALAFDTGHPFGLLTDRPRGQRISTYDFLTNQNEHQGHTLAEEACHSQFRTKSDNKQPNARMTLDAFRLAAVAMEKCVRLQGPLDRTCCSLPRMTSLLAPIALASEVASYALARFVVICIASATPVSIENSTPRAALNP